MQCPRKPGCREPDDAELRRKLHSFSGSNQPLLRERPVTPGPPFLYSLTRTTQVESASTSTLPLPLRLSFLILAAQSSPIHRICFSSSASKCPCFCSQLSPPSTLRLPPPLSPKVFSFLVSLHNVIHPYSPSQPRQGVHRRLLSHLEAGPEPVSYLPH
ncbi:hypothetical protein VTO73DRAFT_7716 [Trametes versicolor]